MLYANVDTPASANARRIERRIKSPVTGEVLLLLELSPPEPFEPSVPPETLELLVSSSSEPSTGVVYVA